MRARRGRDPGRRARRSRHSTDCPGPTAAARARTAPPRTSAPAARRAARRRSQSTSRMSQLTATVLSSHGAASSPNATANSAALFAKIVCGPSRKTTAGASNAGAATSHSRAAYSRALCGAAVLRHVLKFVPQRGDDQQDGETRPDVRRDPSHPPRRIEQQHLPRVDASSQTARPEKTAPAAGPRARAECSAPCCRRTADSRRQSRARPRRAGLGGRWSASLRQIPPEQQLAVDAQLDLVVAAGEELDRLRL